MRLCLVTLFLLLAALSGPASGAPPFAIAADPDDFRITTFAAGLDFPYGMALLPDGSILVGTSAPVAPGAGFFGSSGELLRLMDADDDGVADDDGTVLMAGLPGGITSVRLAGDLVVVSSVLPATISILRRGAGPTDPYTLEGSIGFGFPVPWSHAQASAFAIRETSSRVYEVYFHVGSHFNAVGSADPVPTSGLLSQAVLGESLYRFLLEDTAPGIAVSEPERIASGLRNAFGMAFHPVTGDLWFQDNGIDTPGNEAEPLSADELNRIASGDLGTAVFDFGFPDNYVEYRSGSEVGTGGIDPVVAFQPIPPADGAESEGPGDVAFAPPFFPTGWNDGVFVGFHGKSAAGIANEENPVVFVDLQTLEPVHFIANTEPAIGHLDSLLSTSDSLFLADLSSAGTLGGGGAGTGVVYQIQAVLPDCRDGRDNDGDGRIDLDTATRDDPDFVAGTGDPSCWWAHAPSEVSPCQDGIDNDDDGRIDFDGGASLDLDQDGFVDARFNPAQPATTDSDPECVSPWGEKETSGCGSGYELALLVPLLVRLPRRRLR